MKGRKITYSAEELDWIERNSTRARREAHADFVSRFDRVDVKLSNFNSLCKRHGWMTGRTGRLEKGNVPFNKGRKGFVAPGSEKGWFRKGRKPHNYRGPGHEMVCPKDGYVYMIVAETNPHTGADTHRVLKHLHLWEQANGPVPDGHCLKCLDGDKTNTDPSNWEAIPRALLPRLSGGRWYRPYASFEPEVRPTVLAAAKLEHKAREVRRK
ncbi:HNH endonuclease [Marinovum algicola]|uniref:HNH endonuclease n=1 Tax=Marinovum algicola TaxID=42444 RepID=UPI003B51B6D8